jgi:hypothetical protein
MMTEPKKPHRLKMVNWYDPPRLASTAVRVIVSTVFGEFADRREAMGFANDHLPDMVDATQDYSNRNEDIWLDYIADTGDGWNSTYAMARLLAEDALEIGSDKLPRGDVLIMGGDQVYPTASRLDYYNRLQLPYDTAAKDKWSADKQPDVYAIPGNHDWYDGLSSFMGLFASRRAAVGNPDPKGRTIGGRATRQTRSYFALKLPGNVWLWGTDLQLSGYTDQPQIAFFDYVAKSWMSKGSSVILCVAEPAWANVDASERFSAAEQRFRTFSYMENRAAEAGHDVRLIISGDSHHYARHMEGKRHYITAGGGGAFLHPTHHLTPDVTISSRYPAHDAVKTALKDQRYQRKFTIAKLANTDTERLFPDRATSKKLTGANALFAVKNPLFTAVMIAVAMLFTWLLAANAHFSGQQMQTILATATSNGFWSGIIAYMKLTLLTPWTTLFAAAGWGCLYYFSDFTGKFRRLLSGTGHAVVHAIGLVLSTLVISPWVLGLPCATFCLIVLAGMAGGILSSTIFGLYLFISLNFFKRHANEAFSSLAIPHYKNFLRLKISRDGSITVYPIGLTTTPRDDQTDPPTNPELKPHLIEPPIKP